MPKKPKNPKKPPYATPEAQAPDEPGFIGPWGEQSPEWRQQLASKGYTRKQSQTMWNGYCLTMGLLLMKLEQEAPDDDPGESIKDMLLRQADEMDARLAAEAAEAERAAAPMGGMSQVADELKSGIAANGGEVPAVIHGQGDSMRVLGKEGWTRG